jgi:hypothetical protein
LNKQINNKTYGFQSNTEKNNYQLKGNETQNLRASGKINNRAKLNKIYDTGINQHRP